MDKNVSNVIKQLESRAKIGHIKYGVTTAERTDLDLLQWLQHLQEELMDACVYIERVKGDLNNESTIEPKFPSRF